MLVCVVRHVRIVSKREENVLIVLVFLVCTASKYTVHVSRNFTLVPRLVFVCAQLFCLV